jgi:hypothetical protein
MTYFYNAFNLTVASDIELPPLPAGAPCENAEITICAGKVSADGLDNPDMIKPKSQYNKHSLWLDVPNIARFLIANGREITFSPAPDCDDDSIRLFLLGSCLGSLLQQIGELILHGSAVSFGQHCALFLGNAGSGKSTLAAAFQQQGRQVLSDDLVFTDKQGQIQPGIAQLKLWQDSIDKLALDIAATKAVRPAIKKFAIPTKVDCDKQSMPVKTIFILNSHNQDDFLCEEVKGMNKFQALQAHLYRPYLGAAFAVQAQQFKALSAMASQARLFSITRPNHGFKIAELVQHIAQEMNQENGDRT